MEAADPVEADTFARYLAKYYFVHEGFTAAIPPEATALTEACDYVVCRRNGMTFEIVCFVDRGARPGARFGLSPDDTRNCLKYTRKMGVSQLPASIQVVEVGPCDQHLRRTASPAGVSTRSDVLKVGRHCLAGRHIFENCLDERSAASALASALLFAVASLVAQAARGH
jgi:hypothetical protein